MVACIGFLFLWQGVLVPRYFMEKRPVSAANTNAAPAAVSATTTNTNTATTTVAPAAIVARADISTNTPEQLLVITNENARYIFTSRGGGLKEIELVKFPETIARSRKDNTNAPKVATLNTHAHLPVLGILGGEALVGDGVFTLTETAGVVRAEKTLPNGLRLVKEFAMGTNYLVHAKVRFENTSASALALPLQEWVVGTATPMGGDDDGSAVGLMWYDGTKSKLHETLTSYFDNKTLGCFPGTPKPEYRDGASNIVWTATHNQFFASIVMLDAPAAQIVSRAIELPRPTEGKFSTTNSPARKGFETTVHYPATTIEAGKTIERTVNLFIGPKEYKTLASIADRYNNNSDQAMGFGFFGFFSKALLLVMNWLHSALSVSYGWAIIVITVLLKIIFWPLTAASTRASQKMAALAPQIAALKEKHKDDPAKFQTKQMEFYKENKINPVAGCLPMLVQLPVFFGFFTMLRTAIELRGASFLWAVDLSKSDTIFFVSGFPINPLPLLYIATAIWQTHVTPMSPGMDPTQQKMMRWMPLMFLVILYNFSSGLALYMTVNNLLTILQTKMTKAPVAAATPGGPVAPVTASVLTPTSKKKK
jgi:YidC/Oxa1 family membrane protein insertase